MYCPNRRFSSFGQDRIIGKRKRPSANRRTRRNGRALLGLVQPEPVARGIVQEQGQVNEAHHLLKPTGQVVEQSLPIAVGDNRFGDR